MKIKSIQIFLLLGLLTLSGCVPLLPSKPFTEPLPLNVYPSSDTLHVGDTLWITADFSSQIRLDNGRTINTDGYELDMIFKLIKSEDTIKIYGPTGYCTIPCASGSCRYTLPLPLTQPGLFFLMTCDIIDYRSGGGIKQYDDKGFDIANISVLTRYKFYPNKQALYEKLSTPGDKSQQCTDSPYFSAYPFVVVE